MFLIFFEAICIGISKRVWDCGHYEFDHKNISTSKGHYTKVLLGDNFSTLCLNLQASGLKQLLTGQRDRRQLKNQLCALVTVHCKSELPVLFWLQKIEHLRFKILLFLFTLVKRHKWQWNILQKAVPEDSKAKMDRLQRLWREEIS